MPINKILSNGITLQQATLFPLLLNCRYWLNHECSVTFFGNSELKARIQQSGILTSYEFVEFFNTKKITNKFQFIFEALRRNIVALPYIYKFRGKFDIVYTRSSVLDLTIFPYCLKKVDNKIKWLTVFDNIIKLSDSGRLFVRFLSWLFFKMSLIFLKKADRVFTISQDLKDYLLKEEFESQRVIITGNGVENDLIQKAQKKTGFSWIDALFIGRINETKGVFDLLKVISLLKDWFPDFQLAIMGTGDSFTIGRLKAKIKEHNLSRNVKFLGYIDNQEKFNIIKSSKIFLFPSYKESFGISLLEAACSGVKAFAYDLEAYRNIYKNNEVIFLPVGDYKAIARKVKEVFEKCDFDNRTGELLLGKYSWEKIAEIECKSF